MKGSYENVDGHRVWTPAPDDASPSESSRERSPALISDSEGGCLPDSITELLRLPEVTVQADEFRCAVVICLPSYLAYALSALAPDPLQVQLAAQLVAAGEMDVAELALEGRSR